MSINYYYFFSQVLNAEKTTVNRIIRRFIIATAKKSKTLFTIHGLFRTAVRLKD